TGALNRSATLPCSLFRAVPEGAKAGRPAGARHLPFRDAARNRNGSATQFCHRIAPFRAQTVDRPTRNASHMEARGVSFHWQGKGRRLRLLQTGQGTGLRDSGSRKGYVSALSTALLALALTGCGMQMQETVQEKPKPKEYFAESEYGVKASPRVATAATKLPRGGGRAHVGKPYQVRGQWYYPQEVANYSKTGKASWYGDAFHGRLTANGEIYDMTHLTAAHPTLPMPSYARVT